MTSPRLTQHFRTRACLALSLPLLFTACGTPSAGTPGSAAVTAPTNADVVAFEETFRSFSACDAGFFKSLHDRSKAWAEVAPMGTRAEIGWIQVQNRNDQEDAQVAFNKPPVIGGMKFLSYFDDFSDLGIAGYYYYWGFKVEGSVDEVAKKLRPLVHDSKRFRRDGDSYVRTEVKVKLPGSQWLPIRTSSGTAPGVSKVERVFLIESDQGFTRVSCSLQGGVDGAVLTEVRPDINPQDYPAQLSEMFFDNTAVPTNVIKSLDAARSGKPLWTPKFKKLRYTTKTQTPKKKDWEMTKEIEAQPNGLLRVLEIYSPIFDVQRLMLGDFVNLKSRMNEYSDRRIYLVNKLALDFPAELNPGTVISGEAEAEYQPQKTGDTMQRSVWECKVKDRVDASAIFPSLTGKAARMDCQFSGASNFNVTKAYLEDLGLMVELVRSDGGSATITDMKIER